RGPGDWIQTCALPICVVLAHGAGSNAAAPVLVAAAQAFTAAGLAVLRVDLPFRQKRPTGPPPRGSGPADRAGLRAAEAVMRDLRSEERRVGKGGGDGG